MNSSKKSVIEKTGLMSDDMNESQLIGRLYMLMRLEHSQKRCDAEGTYSDEAVAAYFERKREQYIKI